MRKFSKSYVVGSKVKIFGIDGWHEIKNVHETRLWIQVCGLVGSFQTGHVQAAKHRV